MERYKILVKGIVKSEDNYLIIEKWYDDRIFSPYQWDFINGVVEFGESPDKAVCRVITEAVGLVAEVDRILYTWSFMVGETCNIGIAYLCISAMDDIILSEELNNYKWIKREEFDQYIENKAVLEDIERVEM